MNKVNIFVIHHDKQALVHTCIIANNAHKHKNIHDLKMTENEMCHADNENNNVETHD